MLALPARARLIVPAAQALAIYGSKHLKTLVESVNEGWNNSILLTKTRPQPDYAVGFRCGAFTVDQLKKMEPFIGGLFSVSYFMATYYMYLPFLTCEVKCGAAALDIADRQNARSMTLAVRGAVELFRHVKRGKIKRPEQKVLLPSDPHLRLHRNGRTRKMDRLQIHEKHLRQLDANALHKDLLGHRRRLLVRE